MEFGGDHEEPLTHRVEQLQRERDELRKDIEQLCMQQAGPSYLAVATKMHFERTAGLEQEIESLKNKLAGCVRDKKNLQEELSEAHRIKSQLADLHGAEVSKNKEAEKQVKFFQSCVAAAFAERDKSLMEAERAKEKEEAISQKLADFEERVEELQSAYLEEKKLCASLQAELEELKKLNESFEKIVNKFYDVRERDTGFSADISLQDKCSCLLNDPSDNWIFSSDSSTSTSSYIDSLEEEKAKLRNSIDKLQNNLQMGLEIEQHLRRNIQSMEKKQTILDNLIRGGLSSLRDFHSQQKIEVMNVLEEEASQMKTMLAEIQKNLSQVHMNQEEFSLHALPKDQEFADSECKDVHINRDVDSHVRNEWSDLPTARVVKSTTELSDALAQAMQEKVSALLLLSQQEERHLLEREVNATLQKKFEELQRNLSQVTNEKVEALMELAHLKREYQLLRENSDHGSKRSSHSAHDSDKTITVHEREGKLKNFLKKTYLRHWMGNDHSQSGTGFHGATGESDSTLKKSYNSMDFARLKIENAALQEGMANLERLTASIHRLHVLLLKARDDATSAGPTESIAEALNSIIIEASHVKTALGSSLPVSWAGDESDAITYETLCESSDTAEESKSEKVDAVSAAGIEMVELLILSAEFLQEILTGESSGVEI